MNNKTRQTPEHFSRREDETENDRIFKVAAIQTEPLIGDKEYNVAKTAHLIENAAKQGAKLMVLPELCNTGYIFKSRDEASLLAEEVPGGSTVSAWEKTAKKNRAYICGGLVEKAGKNLFNSVVVVGPEGYLGCYRKTHLWSEEKLWFEPGDLGYPVFDLPFCKIGCLICYDIWFPEIARILSVQGADIVCCLTNLVDAPPIQSKKKPTAVYSAQQMSLMNSIWGILASRVGTERGQEFIGSSCITNPEGNFAAGPTSTDEAGIVIAEINLELPWNNSWSASNIPFNNRRDDLYDSLFGYDPETRSKRSLPDQPAIDKRYI